MPLLHVKSLDRTLLNLNENAHAIYFDDIDERNSDPLTRWCRNYNKALPLHVYDTADKTLGHETYERDNRKIADDCLTISKTLGANGVVLLPLDEWSNVQAQLQKTNPKLEADISRYIAVWSRA